MRDILACIAYGALWAALFWLAFQTRETIRQAEEMREEIRALGVMREWDRFEEGRAK